MPTMDIADHLIETKWMEESADLYQRMESLAVIANERARLLLGFIKSQKVACFAEFQVALSKSECKDIAIMPENEQLVAGSFSAEELKAAFYSEWEDGKPASVMKVNRKLKDRYQALNVPSLDGTANSEPVSLDEIHVNISLLSTDNMGALRGSPGQRQPFNLSALRENERSVINMEDLFAKNKKGKRPIKQVAAGIAGSGKSMAFTQKAPYEWSKEDRDRAFWEHFGLFFVGSLTDPSWWRAEDLARVFGLSCFGLSEREKEEVVGYICEHSEEVLLVADSLDEAVVDESSLLWRILSGTCQELPKLGVIICSRPCEAMLWLTKHGRVDRHFEVVGFTDEKVEQFVYAFFNHDPLKAIELQAQLSDREDARTLMHTPLLAQLICRIFQLGEALPRTQTQLYQAAIMTMLQQTADRKRKELPRSILETLSPPQLQADFDSLCQLAYEALTKNQVAFRKSDLQSANCVDAAIELGFLSSTPGVKISGYGEDAYSFQHHTMIDFLAAVHVVRRVSGKKAKKELRDIVAKVGVDEKYSKFWPFVCGLLSEVESEVLLRVLAQSAGRADRQMAAVRGGGSHFGNVQYMLLLRRCEAECTSQLLHKEETASGAGMATATANAVRAPAWSSSGNLRMPFLKKVFSQRLKFLRLAFLKMFGQFRSEDIRKDQEPTDVADLEIMAMVAAIQEQVLIPMIDPEDDSDW